MIRTRRVPFFRSVASTPMALAAVGITAIGAMLPYTGHLARLLGFRPLPATFFFALAGIVAVYLALVETGKYWFYRYYHAPATPTRSWCPFGRQARDLCPYRMKLLRLCTHGMKSWLPATLLASRAPPKGRGGHEPSCRRSR